MVSNFLINWFQSKCNVWVPPHKNLLNKNKILAKAYILKEQLIQFWTQPSAEAAEKMIKEWIEMAKASGIKQLTTTAKTIDNHLYGILNYYKYHINSAITKGINNKIKTLVKKAYEYRNITMFRLLILVIRDISPHRMKG